MRRPRLRLRWWRRDDGALTPMVVAFALAIYLMIGLSVDGAGKMRAIERANDLAAEAARAGAQAIDIPQAVPGNAIVIQPDRARAAALQYLADAGVTGTATPDPDGVHLTVTVTIPYQPIFLIGFPTFQAQGTATAQLVVG